MIGYAMVGSNDLDRSFAFYDALLALLDARRTMDLGGRGALYAAAPRSPMLGIVKPYDGGTASVGNGQMVALMTREPAQVDALHAKALELGAQCEGPPGPRGPEAFGFYGAYFRDPDGNKLAVYHMRPPAA